MLPRWLGDVLARTFPDADGYDTAFTFTTEEDCKTHHPMAMEPGKHDHVMVEDLGWRIVPDMVKLTVDQAQQFAFTVQTAVDFVRAQEQRKVVPG